MKKFLVFLGVGILISLLSVHIYLQGYLTSWQRLPRPPEKPIQVTSINNGLWILSESGSFYYLSETALFSSCEADCWQVFYEAPADGENIYPAKDYDARTPSVNRFVSSKAIFHSFGGPAGALYVYAIDSKGEIYFWENEMGDFGGAAYVYFPVVVSITIILGFVFNWAIMYKTKM